MVVPLDESDASAFALGYALDHTSDADDIFLVHVTPKGDRAKHKGLFAQSLARCSSAKRKCQSVITSSATMGKAATGVGQAILDVAESKHADSIVIAAGGLSSVRGLWDGSVSQYLNKWAQCNVVVAKPKMYSDDTPADAILLSAGI
eukprot:CAMPEP_0205825310 /NCGR_PEP_ID=MMETSP0206-20130828/24707_1 /ASSEMBLY_ACC=CAM_ASM_000279 /TAXON_ID=36767 /ORGANISM="Euplotes focardii, Strain TN1" /LENGTH=146 /DNA_ID=CAMNT_0053124253 /DNA_START=45 /DNA_END=485 /DNA_ORIENTATION=+